MNKQISLILLILWQIILLGCVASSRPMDLSGKAVPESEFFNRKVAIDYPKLQKYTQCPLEEFLKGMEPGKWIKMSDVQWLYNMKNEQFDIYVLFVKHPVRSDLVMFQKVVINGQDVSEDALTTLFNFTLSEANRDAMQNDGVSDDGTQ